MSDDEGESRTYGRNATASTTAAAAERALEESTKNRGHKHDRSSRGNRESKHKKHKDHKEQKKHKRHGKEKEERRSKQWQTVGSSSDDDSNDNDSCNDNDSENNSNRNSNSNGDKEVSNIGGGKSSEAVSESKEQRKLRKKLEKSEKRERKREKRRADKKSDKSKKRRRKHRHDSDDSNSSSSSDDDSSSDSDNSSSSSSSSSERRRHAKRKRKSNKHRSSSNSNKDISNNINSNSSSSSSSSSNPKAIGLSIDQNEYGKYGIVKEEHFFQKQREFEVYMAEVKNMPGIMSESKRDIMQHFKSFMEDYNTATMPHEKYYNFERWELLQYQRQQQQQHARIQNQSTDGVQEVFNDEEVHRRDKKLSLTQQQQLEFQSLKQRLSSNKDLQQDMRRQSELTSQLQLAFKRGDHVTVKRLERLLAPDEDNKKVVAKHPWSK